MSTKGEATAKVEHDDDGLTIELCLKGCAYLASSETAWLDLSIEEAASLAEQLDAAIDEMASTVRAKEDARKRRISALRAALADLEGLTL